MESIDRLFIEPKATIADCLRAMDQQDSKLLMVGAREKLLGLVSIGDLQRAIIKFADLTIPIKQIMRETNRIGAFTETQDQVRKKMLQFRMEYYPVVDDNRRLIACYFWDEMFGIGLEEKSQFKTSVVIMAGGLGTRMRPITNVIPKPLIPLGEKSLIEEIMDTFDSHGEQNYLISVNYLSDIIEYHLSRSKYKEYISFYLENKRMGTIGSLSLMKPDLPQTFFITNCDILIDEDYSKILEFHEKGKFDITLVCAVKRYDIPYGTVETFKNGLLKELKEKPISDHLINSGLYVMEKNCIDFIPANSYFDITDLIDKVKDSGGQIGVFPVSEQSWTDIGNWEAYVNCLQQRKLI